MVRSWPSRTIAALPSDKKDYRETRKLGLVEMKRKKMVRTDEWLQEHGVCADNFYTDISTIPQAGHGAFALRFDSNAKISSQLLGYQLGGFPIDYINIRNDKIDAVTMEDVNRTLARFPPASEITFVVVGQPEGVEATRQ